MPKDKKDAKDFDSHKFFPFESAQEAWFWFIQAQEARNDGAHVTFGSALMPRPCEPVDILKILDRLYRNRRLLREHLLVLRHYGRRRLPPDKRRTKEAQAYRIWTEALERIEPVLERKGIIVRRQPKAHEGLNYKTPASNYVRVQ